MGFAVGIIYYCCSVYGNLDAYSSAGSAIADVDVLYGLICVVPEGIFVRPVGSPADI